MNDQYQELIEFLEKKLFLELADQNSTFNDIFYLPPNENNNYNNNNFKKEAN